MFLLAVKVEVVAILYCNCPFILNVFFNFQPMPALAFNNEKLNGVEIFLNHITLKSGLIFLLKKVGIYNSNAV